MFKLLCSSNLHRDRIRQLEGISDRAISGIILFEIGLAKYNELCRISGGILSDNVRKLVRSVEWKPKGQDCTWRGIDLSFLPKSASPVFMGWGCSISFKYRRN